MAINKIPKNTELLTLARNLRNEMTRHERHLWYDFLKYYPIKFYKQRIIGNYIADFYCPSAKFVVELDGKQHRTIEGKYNDNIRDEYMESLGITVLRVKNKDIDNHFMVICEQIDKTIKYIIDNK